MIPAATAAAVVIVVVVVVNEDALRAGGVRSQAIRGRGPTFGTRPGYAAAATAGSKKKTKTRVGEEGLVVENSQSHACWRFVLEGITRVGGWRWAGKNQGQGREKEKGW